MKLKNVAIVAAALALAVGMTACGSSSSTAASSSVASSAASSEAASSEAASSEAAEPTTAEYTVYNTTGSTVTELYLYESVPRTRATTWPVRAWLTATAWSSPATWRPTSRLT